jgi:predicted acylesterase/phospholipase RssA
MDATDPRDAQIGVALSGGGHRAAAFAVGALTALLDAGLMPQVRVMTSTSGGSLVNAAVACGRLAASAHGASETDDVRASIAQVTTMIEDIGIAPYRLPRRIVAIAAVVIALTPVIIFGTPKGGALVTFFIALVIVGALLNGLTVLSNRYADGMIVGAVQELYAFPDDTLPRWLPAKSRVVMEREVERYDESGRRPDYAVKFARPFVPQEWAYRDPTLASLACLEGRHLFVITDLAAEDTVHADGDGLHWFRGGQRIVADATLATVVVDSMRFPGYLRARSIPGPIDGTTALLADGGVLDNHALSYFLVGANRADLDILLSVVAENVPRQAAASHRIAQLLAALGLIHRRLSGLYAERILESSWSGRLLSVQLPPDLSAPTTLRPLGRDRTRALIEAGRRATLSALGLPASEDTTQ